jgi:hypothetical protein
VGCIAVVKQLVSCVISWGRAHAHGLEPVTRRREMIGRFNIYGGLLLGLGKGGKEHILVEILAWDGHSCRVNVKVDRDPVRRYVVRGKTP